MAAPKVYTRQEAWKLLRIGHCTLDELIKSGELQVRRIGRRVLIPETAIEAYLRGETTPAQPAP